ncbi:MAG: alkaline phosphatase D family protein [Kofleriaceae bacterium]
MVDAAVFDPRTRHAWCFAGDRFVQFDARRRFLGTGALGIDGWLGLPAAFCTGIDAACYFPPDASVHLFRGGEFVVWRDGPVPLSDGRIARRLGRDGWHALPETWCDGIGAMYYDRARGRPFAFRGDQFVEYGVGTPPRPLVEAGWNLGDFESGFDAVLDHPPSQRVYFFRGDEYVRWDPANRAIEPNYPARIGRPYGRGLPRGKGGGFAGLSPLLGGPLVGAVTATTVSIWVWTLDAAILGRLRVGDRGVARELVEPGLQAAVDAVQPGSRIASFTITELAPGMRHELEVRLDDRVIDRVSVRTPEPASSTGSVMLVLGSCTDMAMYSDVPAYEAMAARRPDAVILNGDNCYYVNAFGSSSDSIFRGGFLFADWDSPKRMLLRQLAARNHPHFAALSRTAPIYATWDDHDFAYNNAAGLPARPWAGREASSAIFRAMWNGAYVAGDGRSIYQSFRDGPVEVFITDSRYEKDPRRQAILGEAQLAWLLEAMVASDAPVKVLVLSTQFLYRVKHESYLTDAPGERASILEAIEARVHGRVLIVSGDVHYSELVRYPIAGPIKTLELVTSSVRTGETDDPLIDWAPGARVWVVQCDAFATIAIDVTETGGTIAIDVIGSDGRTVVGSVWNLADGSLR